jgi:DNA-binding response OmpR family regulator
MIVVVCDSCGQCQSWAKLDENNCPHCGATGLKPPDDQLTTVSVLSDKENGFGHVLLVEDEHSASRLFEEAFTEIEPRRELTVATDGEQALEMLRSSAEFSQSTPDVVVLDLDLPRVGGKEVLKRMRAQDSLASIPVVVFSNSSDQETVKECYQLGANLFIEKPADYNELLVVIREIGELLSTERSELQ